MILQEEEKSSLFILFFLCVFFANITLENTIAKVIDNINIDHQSLNGTVKKKSLKIRIKTSYVQSLIHWRYEVLKQFYQKTDENEH